MKGARKRGRKELLANWPGEKNLFQTQRSKKSGGKIAKNFLAQKSSREDKEVYTL
jgi:hypothetical protein